MNVVMGLNEAAGVFTKGNNSNYAAPLFVNYKLMVSTTKSFINQLYTLNLEK